MIALAIESSNSRGMGHLFRSLIMVKYMRENALDFVYLINDDEKSLDILKQHDIPYEIVDYYDESDWEKEIIESYGVDIWINDKFETSLIMAQNIKSHGVYLALIDDIGPGEVESDVNFIGLIYFSRKKFDSPFTKIGMEYVILNDEINEYKRIRSKLNKIIVSFGGSDPNNNTMKIVKELLKYDYDFDVTVGPNYLHTDELRALNSRGFNIFKNVPSLIQLFSEYDLAITGGGVTCCEANAAGLPCVIVANVPHEENTGKNLEQYGGCIYAGNYEEWDAGLLGRLEDLNLQEMSQKGMQVFDTKALERIFSHIIQNR